MNFNDFENIKKFIRKILSRENRKGLVVGVGILGMMLIGFSGFSGKSIKSVSSSKIDSKHTTELKREKLEKRRDELIDLSSAEKDSENRKELGKELIAI